MRKIIYSINVSLDGYIEDANGSLDWTINAAELLQYFSDQERDISRALYGRRLYELMAAYWPTSDSDPSATPEMLEYGKVWRNTPRLVFSTTLDHVEHNSRLASRLDAEEITALKSQPGGDMIVAGANLAASFLRLGLVDEIRPVVHPVVLGGGKPMFPSLNAPLNLTLLKTRPFTSGAVGLRYEVNRTQ